MAEGLHVSNHNTNSLSTALFKGSVGLWLLHQFQLFAGPHPDMLSKIHEVGMSSGSGGRGGAPPFLIGLLGVGKGNCNVLSSDPYPPPP